MSGFIFPAIWRIFKTAIEKNKQNISTCAVGSTRHPQGWQGLLRIGKNGGAYVDSPERGFYYTGGAHIADYYYITDRHYENVLSVVFPVIRYGNCLGYIIVDLDFLKMNEIVNGGIKRVNFSIL